MVLGNCLRRCTVMMAFMIGSHAVAAQQVEMIKGNELTVQEQIAIITALDRTLVASKRMDFNYWHNYFSLHAEQDPDMEARNDYKAFVTADNKTLMDVVDKSMEYDPAILQPDVYKKAIFSEQWQWGRLGDSILGYNMPTKGTPFDPKLKPNGLGPERMDRTFIKGPDGWY